MCCAISFSTAVHRAYPLPFPHDLLRISPRKTFPVLVFVANTLGAIAKGLDRSSQLPASNGPHDQGIYGEQGKGVVLLWYAFAWWVCTVSVEVHWRGENATLKGNKLSVTCDSDSQPDSESFWYLLRYSYIITPESEITFFGPPVCTRL